MKKYVVRSMFFDSCKVKMIGPFELKQDAPMYKQFCVPGQIENNICDEYIDHFDTYEEALEFTKQKK